MSGSLSARQEILSGMVDSQFPAQLAHRRVTLLDPFQQQFRVSRIPHLALIARRRISGSGCCSSAVPDSS